MRIRVKPSNHSADVQGVRTKPRGSRRQVHFFGRYALANLIFGLFTLGIGLTNLLTRFFGGFWITRACFLMTAVALTHAVTVWRSRSEALLPPQRTAVRVTRWRVAALLNLAFVVILYLAFHDLPAALLGGLLMAYSLGSSVLLARKMTELRRS